MEDTRKKIIEAATDVFVSKGFSGTSISLIAKKANINQSLIYHHIGNKNDLWIEVKKSLIGNDHECVEDYDSFKDFINKTIDERVKVYEEDPRIMRMIQWQALEDEKELVGRMHLSPVSWIKIIEDLQEKGKIKSQFNAPLICVCIHGLINGIIQDSLGLFENNPDNKKNYIQMIKKIIINEFST